MLNRHAFERGRLQLIYRCCYWQRHADRFPKRKPGDLSDAERQLVHEAARRDLGRYANRAGLRAYGHRAHLYGLGASAPTLKAQR